MQNSRHCLRNRLLISLLFIAGTTFAACGDNSQIVGPQENNPSTNNKKDTGGGDDPDAGNPDANNPNNPTPDAGDPDTGDPDTSEPDTGQPDPCLETTPQDAANFAEDYAETLCERILECTANPRLALYVTLLDWTSVDNCKASVLAGGISAEQARAAATNGTLTLNSCEAESCLPSLSAASCDGVHRIIDENQADQVASCYAAWHGDLAQDTSCSIDAQCAGHQICERTDELNSCTGTCVDAGLNQAGQCGDKTCRPDQYCSQENDICMTRPDIGEACDTTKVCRTNATCQGGTCVEIDSEIGAGEPCNFSDKLCDFNLICVSGSCTDAAGLNEACANIGCQSGLYCSADGKCEELGGAGDACSDPAECRTNRCVNGSCTDVDSLCL